MTTEVDTVPLKAEGSALSAEIAAMQVTSASEFVLAGAVLNRVQDQIKTIQAKFADPKAKAWAAHKSISSLEKELLDAREKDKATIQGKMNTFQAADRRRREQEAAEAQRAEQKRLDDIAQAQAEQMEAAGEPELAEMVITQAPVAAPIYVPPPKVAGVSTRTYWTFSLLPEAVGHSTEDVEAELMEQACLALENSEVFRPLAGQLKIRASIIRKRLKRMFMLPNASLLQTQVNALKKDAAAFCGGIVVSSEERVQTTGRGGK